jgi:flavin-dependent dehydrogenase
MQDFLQTNGFCRVFPIISHIIPEGRIGREMRDNRSRLLLSGDATGFVDAFNGEGICSIKTTFAAEAVVDLVM